MSPYECAAFDVPKNRNCDRPEYLYGGEGMMLKRKDTKEIGSRERSWQGDLSVETVQPYSSVILKDKLF